MARVTVARSRAAQDYRASLPSSSVPWHHRNRRAASCCSSPTGDLTRDISRDLATRCPSKLPHQAGNVGVDRKSSVRRSNGTVFELFLFLALSDWRAMALPPPPSSIQDRWEVGLMDSSGSALAGSDCIRAWRNQDLLLDLMRHHESWEAPGCRALEDWHVTLTARDAETRTPPDLAVERANYRQVVTRAT